jgi:hypothetical protein
MPQPELLLLVCAYCKASNDERSEIKRSDMLRKIKRDVETNYKDRISNLNIETLSTYFGDRFTKGNLKSLRGQYGYALALYCGYNDYAHFEENLPVYEEALIKRVLGIILPNFEYPGVTIPEANKNTERLINNSYEFLEFEEPGTRTNCISYVLFWAGELIPQKTEEILNSKNKFRYILTEPAGTKNIKFIKDAIEAEPRLYEFIEIRTLYNHSLGNPLSDGHVCFPLSNDIVMYEKWREGKPKAKYKFHKAIIGVKPESDGEIENDAIEINNQRGRDLFNWFNHIWDQLPPLELKPDSP